MGRRSIETGSAASGAAAAALAAVALVAAAALALGAAGALAAHAAPAAPPAGSLEYDVKAAFLYNFAKFAEWPPEAWSGGEHEPLALCIFGADPFGARLDELVKGETVAGRTLAVRRIRQASELRSCQIAFFSRAEREHTAEALNSLRGSNVLTVGESDGFAEQGGIVQFYLEDNKVRFAVNLDALDATHLKMSSKLLRLARVLRPAAHAGER